MADTKLPASGNIRIWFGLENSIANYLAPTIAEINAMVDVSDAVSWNDFNHMLQASNTLDDPAITALGKVQTVGAAQFGGQMSFYYPRSFTDTSNKYQVVYDLLDQPRTKGYMVVRIDGTQSGTSAVAGDLVHVFKVMTDGYAESIVGEEAFRYTINFQPQGQIAVRIPARGVTSGTPVTQVTTVLYQGAAVTTLAATVANQYYKLEGKVDTRFLTNELIWTSSNVTKATVSNTGLVTMIASGSATITATYPGGGTAGTVALTIT
jgi:hypothetical protein